MYMVWGILRKTQNGFIEIEHHCDRIDKNKTIIDNETIIETPQKYDTNYQMNKTEK